MYWINAFNSRAGAVTLEDLLTLIVLETKNVKRMYEQSKPMLNPISNH